MRLKSRPHQWLIAIALYAAILPSCMAEKLEDVVRQAIASNPEIRMQTARRYGQDSQLRSSLAGYFPQIDITAAYGRDHNTNYFTRQENPLNGSMTLSKREAVFSVKQMLFDGFAVRGEVEAEAARLQSSSYFVQAKLEDVLLQATASYIDTIMLRSIFMHAKDHVTNQQGIFDQLSNGDLKNAQRGDIELAKSRLSLAQSILLDLQREIRDSQADYVRVVGAKPGVMFRPEAPDKQLPSSEDAAVAVAISNNPQISIANSEIRAARADKRVSKSHYFPRIELEVSGSNNNNVDGITQHTHSLSAMLQMKYNLFRGGKDVALERKSAWAIEEKKELLNSNIRLVEQNMRRIWSAYVNYKGQMMHLKERVDALQRTRDVYYKEVTEGNRVVLDLLDADDELYRAKANYVATQYQELLSRFMVLQGMGKLKDYFNVAAPSLGDSTTPWLNGF